MFKLFVFLKSQNKGILVMKCILFTLRSVCPIRKYQKYIFIKYRYSTYQKKTNVTI